MNMEFKEFTDPLSCDYDLKSNGEVEKKEELSRNTSSVVEEFNGLYFNLGCPEVFELESYGMTMNDITRPTANSLRKLQKYASDCKTLGEKNKHK